MSDAQARMTADRYVRDSARTLVEADLQHLRGGLGQKSLGARAVDRVKLGAIETYEDALDVAAENKGVIAAVAAVIAVWLARHPILALFGFDEADDEEEE